jgi:hypothetical protein
MSSTLHKPTPEKNSGDQDQHIMSLMLSMADTTWRMFVPPALFVWGGLSADLSWHTKPWLTLLSAALGLGVSVLLVKKQLKQV